MFEGGAAAADPGGLVGDAGEGAEGVDAADGEDGARVEVLGCGEEFGEGEIGLGGG